MGAAVAAPLMLLVLITGLQVHRVHGIWGKRASQGAEMLPFSMQLERSMQGAISLLF